MNDYRVTYTSTIHNTPVTETVEGLQLMEVLAEIDNSDELVLVSVQKI